MGSVVYEFEPDWERDQYDYDMAVPPKSYLIYCDRCGSFRVVDEINPIFLLTYLAIGAGLGTLWKGLINASVFNGSALGAVFCWGIFGLAVLILVVRAWTYGDHLCLKCGNTKISGDDSLEYGSREWPKLMDVEERSAHQHKRAPAHWYDDLWFFLIACLAMVLIILGPLLILGMGGFERYKAFLKEKIQAH